MAGNVINGDRAQREFMVVLFNYNCAAASSRMRARLSRLSPWESFPLRSYFFSASNTVIGCYGTEPEEVIRLTPEQAGSCFSPELDSLAGQFQRSVTRVMLISQR